MRLKSLFSAILVLMMSGTVFAQHSDVEFGYDNLATPTSIDIEFGELTTENFGIFESDMEELDPFDPGNFSSDEPGFATNDLEGLLVNPGDGIFLNALDASANSSFGVGYVNFYNPLTDSLEASGRLAVLDNSAGTSDLIINGAAVESGPTSQFIGLADIDGDVHDHVVIDLLDDGTAPTGAYGVLFELTADFDPADGVMDVTSEKFWIVWNHGMDEEDFENLAIPKFGVSAVPEPAAASLLLFGAVGLVARRRRR